MLAGKRRVDRDRAVAIGAVARCAYPGGGRLALGSIPLWRRRRVRHSHHREQHARNHMLHHVSPFNRISLPDAGCILAHLPCPQNGTGEEYAVATTA